MEIERVAKLVAIDARAQKLISLYNEYSSFMFQFILPMYQFCQKGLEAFEKLCNKEFLKNTFGCSRHKNEILSLLKSREIKAQLRDSRSDGKKESNEIQSEERVDERGNYYFVDVFLEF